MKQSSQKQKNQALTYNCFLNIFLKIDADRVYILWRIVMKQYNKQYDAFYDDVKNVWLEDVCSDNNCNYCKDRPSEPPLEELGFKL